MLSKYDKSRIKYLTTGPVLDTLAGTRRRIELLTWPEVWLLMAHYGCQIEELEYRMWNSKRYRRRQPARTRLVPQYALFRRART